MCFACIPYGQVSITGRDIGLYEISSAGIYLSITPAPLDMEIVKIVQLVLCLRLKELGGREWTSEVEPRHEKTGLLSYVVYHYTKIRLCWHQSSQVFF